MIGCLHPIEEHRSVVDDTGLWLRCAHRERWLWIFTRRCDCWEPAMTRFGRRYDLWTEKEESGK